MHFQKMLISSIITNVFYCCCLSNFTSEHEKEVKDVRHFLTDDKQWYSPVNLVRSSMITKSGWLPLHYSPEHSIIQTLNKRKHSSGLDVTFDFDAEKPRVTGGLLQFTYEFEKLFFHWDNKMDDLGSFHTIEGNYYPMELQAYYQIIPPMSILGGLQLSFSHRRHVHTVIISQFFKLDDNKNEAIDSILTGSKTSIDKLMPQLQEYATYKGSLVVAPFTENVKWIISLKPQKISTAQLIQFRMQHTITDPTRAIQPLYRRKVFYIDPWKN